MCMFRRDMAAPMFRRTRNKTAEHDFLHPAQEPSKVAESSLTPKETNKTQGCGPGSAHGSQRATAHKVLILSRQLSATEYISVLWV